VNYFQIFDVSHKIMIFVKISCHLSKLTKIGLPNHFTNASMKKEGSKCFFPLDNNNIPVGPKVLENHSATLFKNK
jgi:hypothetical protein